MEKIKKMLWILYYYPTYGFNYWKTRHLRGLLKVMDSEATISYICENGCSVSRYGDGELQMMSHYLQNGSPDDFHVDTFQNFNRDLAQRLVEIYQRRNNQHLVCLPYSFKKAVGYNVYESLFWKREWLGRHEMLDALSLDKTFGDTNFTRFYMGRHDICDYPGYVTRIKQIWDKKEVLIVEGNKSRLGVGNDLFDNSKKIERILCPSTNAYDKYEEILKAGKTAGKGKLVLIALGHTATVLAYDLSCAGIQAIDIGHVDIEYEWFRMKAKSKKPVPNKYVNEVPEGRINHDFKDANYLSQIILNIN